MDDVSPLIQRLDDRTAKIAVVGQGYVGLPVAIRAAEVGFPVVGYDVASTRIAALRAGRSYVEDVTDDRLRRALDGGYWPTADPLDLRAFDVGVITVPTPLREGAPDLSYIEGAARDLASRLAPGALVVLESTTYPGTTEELVRPILETTGLKAGREFFLGYSPERIDPGNQEWTFVNTPKVVSGDRRRVASCGRTLLRVARRHGGSRRLAGRSRAREAAGEHVPSREHRAGERARDVRT